MRGCLPDTRVIAQTEFVKSIQDRRSIAKHPLPFIFAAASKMGRDVDDDLKGAFLRLMRKDLFDDQVKTVAAVTKKTDPVDLASLARKLNG